MAASFLTEQQAKRSAVFVPSASHLGSRIAPLMLDSAAAQDESVGALASKNAGEAKMAQPCSRVRLLKAGARSSRGIPLLLLLLGGQVQAEKQAKPALGRLLDSLAQVQRYGDVHISPDGRRVAWVQQVPSPDKTAIYVANLQAPSQPHLRVTAGEEKNSAAEHG